MDKYYPRLFERTTLPKGRNRIAGATHSYCPEIASNIICGFKFPGESKTVSQGSGIIDSMSPSGEEKTARKKPTKKTELKPEAVEPKLLSGGNPQIAKGYGNEPVQAYIAAMPGWKSEVGKRIDEIIERTVPDVQKAVKWNSPMYGMQEGHYFLSLHCFTKYIKVAFFRGTSLDPLPPGESKQQEVRYLNIHEADELDEAQFAAWVEQASVLPGERM